MMKFLADMPSCLGGGDYGINVTWQYAKLTAPWRFESFSYSDFKMWSDETWQTCPLVSGVGITE